MNALEISEVYLKAAKAATDLRWKRHMLELAGQFAAEWFK